MILKSRFLLVIIALWVMIPASAILMAQEDPPPANAIQVDLQETGGRDYSIIVGLVVLLLLLLLVVRWRRKKGTRQAPAASDVSPSLMPPGGTPDADQATKDAESTLAGAEAVPSSVVLIGIQPQSVAGQSFPLVQPMTTIGRSRRGNHIQIDDKTMSRQHSQCT